MPVEAASGVARLVLVLLVVPLVTFLIRRRWRLAEARSHKIRQLLVLASHESERAELEAAIEYNGFSSSSSSSSSSFSLPSSVVLRQQCAVCYSPTTTRCSRCKAVRYCSGRCQIIHWRQGHREECHPQRSPTRDSSIAGGSPQLNVTSEVSTLIEDIVVEPSNCQMESVESPAEILGSIGQSFCSRVTGGKKIDDVEPLANSPERATAVTDFHDECRRGFRLLSNAPDPVLNIIDSTLGPEAPLSNGIGSHVPARVADVNDGTTPEVSPSCSTDNAGLTGCVNNTVSCSGKSNKKISKLNNVSIECITSSSISGLHCTIPEKIVGSDPSICTSELLGTTMVAAGFLQESDCKESVHCSSRNSYNNAEPLLRHTLYMGDCSVPAELSQSSTPTAHLNDYMQHKQSEKRIPDNEASLTKKLALDHFTPKGSLLKVHETLDFPSSKIAVGATFSKSSIQRSTSQVASVEQLQAASRGLCASCVTPEKANTLNPVPSSSFETIISGSNANAGLKTSKRKVAQQLKVPKLAKHNPTVFGNEISGMQNKMLFSYDLFVKLYNDKVELRPFGLTNCGNSCYANAVLQCLAFTPPLTAYLLHGLHTKKCKRAEWCFTCEFENLILHSSEAKFPLSPIRILSQIHSIGSNLGYGKEEDAHEFLRYAIDAMRSVCLEETSGSVSGSLMEHTTLLELTFGGYLRSNIKCLKCHGKSVRHERMMDLTVEIDGNIGTLEEGLKQFTTPEILEGDNKYLCERCKSYVKARKRLTVYEAPNVLTIALKRFQSGKFGKINKPVHFPEELDLTPYMSDRSIRSPLYKLYAAVVHLDVMNASFSGHYVCYVKNKHDQWYKIDDSKVKPVDLDRVLSKGAYMLLYARSSPRPPNLIAASIHSGCVKGRKNGLSDAVLSDRNSSRSRVNCADSLDNLPTRTGSLKNGALRKYFEQLPPHWVSRSDSSSDSSSLFSYSDEASCSTDSTRDSTSTDEYSECFFGDSVHSWNSPTSASADSDLCSPSIAGSRNSDCQEQDSLSTHVYFPNQKSLAETLNYVNRKVEGDRAAVARRTEFRSRMESPPILYSDPTNLCHRIVDSS